MGKDFILKILIACILVSFCPFLFYIHIWINQDNKQRIYQTSVSCKDNCNFYLNLAGTHDGSRVDVDNENEVSESSPRILENLMILPLGIYADHWEEHFVEWNNAKLCSSVPGINSINFSLVYDPTLIQEADLLIFNLTDLNLEKYEDQNDWISATLPRKSNPDQIWALFWREPPGKLNISSHKLSWLDNLFHWTISYRTDSDIFYPFGVIKDLEKERSRWTRRHTRRGSVWFSNKCNSSSKREVFVHQMQNLNDYKGSNFKTHLYGDCVNVKPKTRLGKSGMETLKKSIMFYLALEEEICDDYITEQYFKSLNHGYVPIVFGGADVGYDEVGLAGTYIDAFDFNSLNELVSYLIHLERRSSELNSYLLWMREYEISSASNWVCELKSALLARTTAEVISDFSKFWGQKKCYGDFRNTLLEFEE